MEKVECGCPERQCWLSSIAVKHVGKVCGSAKDGDNVNGSSAWPRLQVSSSACQGSMPIALEALRDSRSLGDLFSPIGMQPHYCCIRQNEMCPGRSGISTWLDRIVGTSTPIATRTAWTWTWFMPSWSETINAGTLWCQVVVSAWFPRK